MNLGKCAICWKESAYAVGHCQMCEGCYAKIQLETFKIEKFEEAWSGMSWTEQNKILKKLNLERGKLKFPDIDKVRKIRG